MSHSGFLFDDFVFTTFFPPYTQSTADNYENGVLSSKLAVGLDSANLSPLKSDRTVAYMSGTSKLLSENEPHFQGFMDDRKLASVNR